MLAFFEAGGALEGRWGWLETLRAAELGDEIQFFENYSGLWPPQEPMVFRGTLEDWAGQLYIQSEDARIPANKAAWLGNAFGVARPYHGAQSPLYFGPFHAEKTYYHLKFDPGRVNWLDFTLDSIGTVASVVGANLVVETFQISPKVAKGAQAVDAVLSGGGVIKSLVVDLDIEGAILAGGGFLPGPIGGGFNLAAVYHDLEAGFYWTP